MSNQVILVLDRELANGLHDAATADEALTAIEHEVVAALEVDPETRIEQVARAIAADEQRRYSEESALGFVLEFTEADWEAMLKLQREALRASARAALSALCENPGQGRGLVDGASPTPVGHDEPGGDSND